MSIGNGSVIVNTEDELSRVQRKYIKLAPLCNIEKVAKGTPQLAPQEKQMNILKNEMEETMLYLSITKQRRNAIQIARAKRNICSSVLNYESLLEKLRTEKEQQSEMDILNYLANKNKLNLLKEIPTENDEIAMYERANNSLRRMETRLDLATKRLCAINTRNKIMREEINRLLVERKMFNIQWRQAIERLVRGKGYLLDIYEVATIAFAERDECCRKLDVLKWKGLFQLNKDISDMQNYIGDLNHLANLEEFLRIKCSMRVCEADEIEEMEAQEEVQYCEKAIAKLDDLLEQIFSFVGMEGATTVVRPFRVRETKNSSIFLRMCEVMQENMFIRKDIDIIRRQIVDYQDIKESSTEKRKKEIALLRMQLSEQKQRTQELRERNFAAKVTLNKVVSGIDELVRISKCEITPMLKLLGKKQPTEWNVRKYINILELEVKSIVEVVYGAVQPPQQTSKSQKGLSKQPKKIVADPYVEMIRPNPIEKLVPYLPCAYCVEEYVMNQVTEAVPANKHYLHEIFHLSDPNTRFGIFTLTIPHRRHPSRDEKVDRSTENN